MARQGHCAGPEIVRCLLVPGVSLLVRRGVPMSGNPEADLKRSSELAVALDDSNSDALALLSRVDRLERQ